MSTSGTLTKNGDTYTGFIADLAFDADIELKPNSRKEQDKHPDYVVSGKSPRGRDIEIGAAWWRESQAGNRYLSLTVNVLGNAHRVNGHLSDDNPDIVQIRPWAEFG